MAHAFWKGTLSFGLVEIGVALRPVRGASDFSFSLLDRRDFAPVGYKRYNKRTGREVPWDRVVRGYEYEDDQFVVLTDDELHRANAEATQTMDLVAFVDRAEIDPVYFETPYYVEPQRKSSRSYALLRDTLSKTGLVGIVRIVLRTRQHVAALLVRDQVLMLDILRYEEELRAPSDLSLDADAKTGKKGRGKAKPAARSPRSAPAPTAAELKMATRLVEEMRERWSPADYRDEYRRDVMALIQKKVKSGKTHEIVEPAAEPTARPTREVVDLMPLLKKSLGRRAPAAAARPHAGPRARVTGKRRKEA